jgi:hypothetical protein
VSESKKPARYTLKTYLKRRRSFLHRILFNLRLGRVVSLLQLRRPALIIDLGASTCSSTRRLRESFPGSTIIAIDRDLEPQRAASQEECLRVCADAP